MAKLSIQNKKEIITKEMIKTFAKHSKPDIQTAYNKWWMNTRTNGGLRLTPAGYKVLSSMDYDTYKFKVENIMTTRYMILMEKRLQAPYYLNKIAKLNCNLVMFGSEDATMLNLYGGDFKSFIESYR